MIKGEPLTVHVGRTAVTIVRYADLGRCAWGGHGCGARIYWCFTVNNKRMPVDPTPDAEGLYVSHWATCPKREVFRRWQRARRKAAVVRA